MQTSKLIRLSALFMSVAAIASPTLAADAVDGSKGGAPGTSRDAPLTLPGKLTPKPLPQFDPSTLGRGMDGLDPAAAAESMATVTWSKGGAVSETPASQGMRDIINAVQGSNPDQSSSRTIVATDDRTQVTDTSTYPDYTVGWLWAQDPKGNWSTCTATLIGPKTLLTAAHCVYDHAAGGWATTITFVPGATDAQTAPNGQFEVVNANILKGFIDNYDGKNYGSIMAWDLGELELGEDAGTQLGWMGFRPDDASDFKAMMLGYPGDKPDGTMWQSSCTIPKANFGDQVFWHDCDTANGSSGAPMYESDPKGNLYIRGIQVAEDDKVNYGLRLIDAYFQFIKDNYK